MSSPGSAQPTDYYRALGLDPRTPPHALLAQLAHRIAQTTIGPERMLMEQARAVLGDPEKKSIYDVRLRDPQAPPWTPAELHQLALAQLSQPTPSGGIADKITAVPRRVLAAVAGALAIVLVAVVTLVSCTGGSADTGTSADTNAAAGASSDTESASGDCIAFTGPLDEDDLNEAAWVKGAEPDYALVLTDAYPLPEPLASETAQLNGSMAPGLGLIELRGGDIEVGIEDYNYLEPDRRQRGMAPGNEEFGYLAAYFTPQGELIDTYEQADITDGTSPRKSDRLSSQGKYSYGTFRVAATGGITIPAKADYSKTDGKYALDVLAADDGVWMLLRGGTDLYKAELVKTSGDADPTSCV